MKIFFLLVLIVVLNSMNYKVFVGRKKKKNSTTHCKSNLPSSPGRRAGNLSSTEDPKVRGGERTCVWPAGETKGTTQGTSISCPKPVRLYSCLDWNCGFCLECFPWWVLGWQPLPRKVFWKVSAFLGRPKAILVPGMLLELYIHKYAWPVFSASPWMQDVWMKYSHHSYIVQTHK